MATRHWSYWTEKNTGEVPVFAVADSLGVSDSTVMAYVAQRHGARYVGGTSRFLIWAEDARSLEEHFKQVHADPQPFRTA